MTSTPRRHEVFTALTLLLVGVSLAGERGAGNDWPQWRGPLANGVAPAANPPVRWSESSNVRWKVELPGKGLSTPIVHGRRIFLTAAIETDQPADADRVAAAAEAVPAWQRGRSIQPARVVEFVVLALDRESGRTLWRKTLRRTAPHEGTHIDGSWASNSPVTDGKLLIAHFGSNGTYALDFDGNLEWERDLGDMKTRNGFGEGSSPVLHGNTVVINWDHEGPSFIVALDRRSGKTLWTRDRDEVTSWATPIVVEHGGRTQVVVNATAKTRGYDLKTGELLWEVGGMTVNTIPSPVHGAGRVYVTSGFRGNMLQAIDLAAAKGDITDGGAIAWQFDRDTPYVPSPLLYQDRVWVIKHLKGIVSCFDARSGKRHYGPERLEGIEGVYASPVGAAGRVYVVGRNGATAVLASGPELEVLALNRLDDNFDASPAIAGDELLLRGRKHLYSIAAE